MDERNAHERLHLRLRDHDLALRQEQDQVAVRADLLEDAAVLDDVRVRRHPVHLRRLAPADGVAVFDDGIAKFYVVFGVGRVDVTRRLLLLFAVDFSDVFVALNVAGFGI